MIGVILIEEWLIHSNMGIGCTCCKMNIKLCKIATNLCLIFLLSPFQVTYICSSQVLVPLRDFPALLHRCNTGTTSFSISFAFLLRSSTLPCNFPSPLISVWYSCSYLSLWEVLHSCLLPPAHIQTGKSCPLSHCLCPTTVFIFLIHYFLLIMASCESFWKRYHSWTLLSTVNWETNLASITLICLHAFIFGCQILGRWDYFWFYLLMKSLI